MSVNPYLRDFASTLLMRYPTDGADMSYSEWLMSNTHHPRNPGRPFSFDGFEFQKAIADDLSPVLSVIKPSQIGLTEIQIRKALAFLVRNRGTSLIYSMPNLAMFRRVSKTRVKPLMTRERVFQSTNGDSNSMDLYEMGGSFAYLTGMTEGDATSIPADFLCHDEVDLSDQQIIGLYQSRLQASNWKLTHKFSTPTHPNFGIDASYNASDQMEYMQKCQACRHWQLPLFDIRHIHLTGYHGDGNLKQLDADMLAAIDFGASYVKCERCSVELDLLNPALREWVPRFPGRRGRGYRVRPFCTASLMLEYVCMQLIERRLLDDLKGWYNTVLGEPFADGSNQLTEDSVRARLKGPQSPEIGAGVPFAIGIDQGLICHVTGGPISGDIVQPTLFELVPADNLVERIEEICKEYNVVCGAIDRYPYTPTANEVYAASKNKIVPTEYRGKAAVNLVKDEFDELSHAQINRTIAIDRTVKLVQNRRLDLVGYGAYADVLVQHMCDMVRIESPEKEATWEKRTGNDHFMHSLALLEMSLRIKEVANFNFSTTDRTEYGFIQVTDGVANAKGNTLFGKDRPMYSPAGLL